MSELLSITDEVTLTRDERDSQDWVIKLPAKQTIGRWRVESYSDTDDTVTRLRVNGKDQKVAESVDGNDMWWWTPWEDGPEDVPITVDDDSSRIVANQDLNEYSGIPPGEGVWIIDGEEYPVTVRADWINASDLELRDCSVSDNEPTVGDTVTVEATVFNTSYNPMKCDAEVFVGDARETVAVTTDGRGNTGTQQQRVSASFEVTQPGSVDYGVDLTNITHNYS